jgi:hypothetical protein
MADYYDEREEIEATERGVRIPQARRKNWPNTTATKKGSAVTLTPKQKVRKLESELDSNLNLQKMLREEEIRLRQDIRKADIPNQPPAGAGNMFRVIVRFANGGPDYTYLLARVGDRWFTTGTSEEQKMFPSWQKLCEWINTTYWHSHVERLVVTGKTNWPTEYTGEVPF